MEPTKNAAAQELGRLRMKKLTEEERKAMSSRGGVIGGEARAKSLTKNQRSAIAKKAAAARWAKQSKSGGEQ